MGRVKVKVKIMVEVRVMVIVKIMVEVRVMVIVKIMVKVKVRTILGLWCPEREIHDTQTYIIL
jgi:hypothetical protein